ncbi:MAG: RNA polymerase sigma factor [Patescibacteria group bacterium]|nr:RNA polymerase sigma factor [Patescibacteria group bacterium]
MSLSVSKLNQLAEQAQSGNTDAFGQIFDLLSDNIYKFLAFRVKDPEIAKDLTSQTFLEAWQSLKRYNANRSFKTWIFSIARYKLIDHYRSFKPQVSLDAVTDIPDDTDIGVETANALESYAIIDALNHLPEMYQTVLKLKLIEQLEYSEISDITGKTENNLRVIFKRGLDHLRETLLDEQ